MRIAYMIGGHDGPLSAQNTVINISLVMRDALGVEQQCVACDAQYV